MQLVGLHCVSTDENDLIRTHLRYVEWAESYTHTNRHVIAYRFDGGLGLLVTYARPKMVSERLHQPKL